MTNWREINYPFKKFTEELTQTWINAGFNKKETGKWLESNLRPNDAKFAQWLGNIRKVSAEWFLDEGDEEDLRKEYKEYLEKRETKKDGRINAQEWLDQNYPKEKRSEIYTIYLNEPNLEGELDLRDFTFNNLLDTIIGVKVLISPAVDETKLTFKNKPEKAEIILTNPQKYINQNYPTEKERGKITKLDINYKDFEGDLDLSDFVNLEVLNFQFNKLTYLALPANSTNLKELNLGDNNFPATQNLSFLTSATNLERLFLGNWVEERINRNIYNRFTGSLDYLSGMKKLNWLDISNTDINEVDLTKLPTSLEKIEYLTHCRPNCKLTEIVPQLRRFGYDKCRKCQQFNTSENWCQPCAEQEWKHLTGQKLIEKFIERQPTFDRRGKEKTDKLQWIPYEEFTNIEYLAEGGFSKIYKAKWEKSKYYYYPNKRDKKVPDEDLVLKFLNNSQNITLEFLMEIANTKLVDGAYDNNVGIYSSGNIIKCHGISQDPNTKNYLMVMEYGGDNLRQYLKNRVNELSWEDKLGKLVDISLGLEVIHNQNLVHRDLHSGNILNSSHRNSSITDLGLTKLVNSQSEEGKIFGVLPYVAPEVLLSKPYTQKADIYSFGIIAYELLSGLPPYYDQEFDIHLALKICQGLRPNFKIKIPRLLENLIERCWDVDPKKRPSADKSRHLHETLNDWYTEIINKKDTEFTQQLQEAEEYNQNLPDEVKFPKYEIHPGAVYHSKVINTKQITQFLEKLKVEEYQHSANLELDINDLVKELNIQEDPQEESSLQAQIQIPPK